MEKLENVIFRNGYKYEKVLDLPLGFVYKQLSIESGSFVSFEVFKRRISPRKTSIIGGVEVEFKEKELFPTNEAFGEWAFTCPTMERVEVRLEQFKREAND